MNILWLLLVGGALIFLQSLIIGRGAAKLEYKRYFSRAKVFEGESVEMVEVLYNRRFLPLPYLRVESRISPELLFSSQQNLEIAENLYHRSVFFIGPYSRITRRHQVLCSRRGYYNVSSVTLTSGDLFNIKQTTRSLDVNLHVTVYPKIIDLRESALPSSRFMGDLVVKRWIAPDPFLYSGIRDYRMGDPMKDVHWLASARTGRLMVKLRDFTASPKLMVLLNIQPKETLWAELGTAERESIEHGVKLAASIMMQAVDAGVETGFASNGNLRGEQYHTVLVPPAATREHREALLETLARLELHRVRSCHTFLSELPISGDTDYLLITSYRSELVDERITALRARGNTADYIMLGEGGDAA